MKFNNHKSLAGKHAIFTASKPSWLNYSEDGFKDAYWRATAATRGTDLHNYAEQAIRLKQRQPNCEKTLCMHINDAIKYDMSPEVVLYHSDNFYGTADAIRYFEKERVLRIHDLKTGTGKVHPEQLKVYAALFCLEYYKDPYKMSFILQIYQNDEIMDIPCSSEEVDRIMQTIKMGDAIVNEIKED